MITINNICLFPQFSPSEIKLLYTLVLCIILDVFLGVAKSINLKELSSRTGIKGLSKHFVVLMLVLVGTIILHNLDLENLILPFTTFYVIFYLVSIAESLAKLGVPIPNFITDKLEQLKDGEQEKFKVYEER